MLSMMALRMVVYAYHGALQPTAHVSSRAVNGGVHDASPLDACR
jgi:hypothetical protein